MRFRNALGVSFATALVLTAAIAAAELAVLHFPHLKNQKVITTDQLTQLIKNALAIVAGAGALIALVTTYRRQKTTETADIREQTRIFNERFTTAASQLADPNPAIRIAGIYAMAGLADDWEHQRQTCIDVLCANLRIPYNPQPANDAAPAEKTTWHAHREARHTLIRTITAHLQPDGKRALNHTTWSHQNLDFTGVNFDGGDFTEAIFRSTVSFQGAQFTEGAVSFNSAQFAGSDINFDRAQFTNGTVGFDYAQFTEGDVSFFHSQFSGGEVRFLSAQFTGCTVSFGSAQFTSSTIGFIEAQFTGGIVDFNGAEFTGGTVYFVGALFAGGTVHFERAQFTGGDIDFGSAQFSGGTVRFGGAHFVSGDVNFVNAQFTGGTVEISTPAIWSTPPRFGFKDQLPPGLRLPSLPLGTARP